jgi:hypothetical protein
MKRATKGLTPEIAVRVDALYSAAAGMEKRAERHRVADRFDRYVRAMMASSRLRICAWALLLKCFSVADLDRVGGLIDQRFAVKARRKSA